jgi:hypothetical protein
MRSLAIAVVALAALFGEPALSQSTNPNSGSAYLPACRVAGQDQDPSPAEITRASYCLGMVAALVGVAPILEPRYRFCFPKDSNTQQAVRVVVAFLDKNPSMLHYDFRIVALIAMREAWPCK